MNLEVLPYDFCKLQPSKASKDFYAKIRKMTFSHYFIDVMSRQPCVKASKASPTQKLHGLQGGGLQEF
jgi:hypothetical protein